MHSGGSSQFTSSRLVPLLRAFCGRGSDWFEPLVIFVREPFRLTDLPRAKVVGDNACTTSGELRIYLCVFVSILQKCFEENSSCIMEMYCVFS